MNPKLSRTKKIVIGVVVAYVFGFVVLGIYTVTKHSHKSNQTTTSGSSLAVGSAAPQTITNVIASYLQAEEDSVGADQTSPTSWLTTVQPITTPAWFAQLQPNLDGSTSGTSQDYFTARNNGYTIKASISNCSSSSSISASATTATVTCALNDETVYHATGIAVQVTNLPFGWTHNGLQPAPTISLVSQNGKWLVNNETIDEQTTE